MPFELFETVRIPKDRIGALLGQKGKAKKKLEKKAGVAISVDSDSGIVDVEGNEKSTAFFDAVNAVKAIGRGFSPENAFLLFGGENVLEIIKMPDIVKGGEKTLQTKRGRIIGRQGLAREAMEKATGTKISVFGKTVSIIGKVEDVQIARKAVEMLLLGARHQKAMDFLRRETIEREEFRL